MHGQQKIQRLSKYSKASIRVKNKIGGDFFSLFKVIANGDVLAFAVI